LISSSILSASRFAFQRQARSSDRVAPNVVGEVGVIA
jgi:hypothetical protein